ncbi:hypothetical protein I7I51_04212 [Histoplasma capsulatum]|uniref:Uncharacterized protein n=1 Tax=Ajellomyces capsulatus TaxID=5037 RepID=A0A8A1M8G4_AJECA|nr:hypothetical protein I7I51_04212 [Histoplasma capsulatum]
MEKSMEGFGGVGCDKNSNLGLKIIYRVGWDFTEAVHSTNVESGAKALVPARRVACQQNMRVEDCVFSHYCLCIGGVFKHAAMYDGRPWVLRQDNMCQAAEPLVAYCRYHTGVSGLRLRKGRGVFIAHLCAAPYCSAADGGKPLANFSTSSQHISSPSAPWQQHCSGCPV